MSRHRSPGVHRAAPAVRNGMTAAAVAGGTLAVVIPTIAMATGPAAGAAAGEVTEMRLTSDGESTVDGVTMVTRFLPVRETREPEPPEVSVAELLKGAGLADIARKAAEEQAARAARAWCDADLGGLGRVKPWVREGARFLSCLYDEPSLIGVSGRGRVSDHPTGHAVDLMVRGGRGDRIAECALANQEELGISYVIWEQRINYGDGWERMSDRGSDTENHVDHVHVSFEKTAPPGDPVAERCG